MNRPLLYKSLFSLILSLPLSAVFAYEYDPYNGEEINELCAGCHGEYGQGGKEGEYPRLAGQPIEFTAKQLHLFRQRKRPNLAMVEYIDERQMPDEDILDVSRYLAEIKLKTKLPPADENAPGFDAYARLLESKKLMQIPRAEGDIEKGRKLYNKECDSCHGKEGWGDHKKGVPMIAGQYTNYLWRQVKKLRNKIRIHDEDAPEEELLDDFSDEEIRDIFAYLSIVDD
ncbi:MAG: c-type cytochrome [Chromatiales bacterium]|nr:c-type cytochrome [Chromatiales bacterium]